MIFTEKEMQEIIEYSKQAKEITTDDFIYRLEQIRDGANVHTVNKAIFYLKHFSSNQAIQFQYGPHYDRLHELKTYIVEALDKKDFKKLSSMMGGWF